MAGELYRPFFTMRILLMIALFGLLWPVHAARYHYGPYAFKGKYQPEDTTGAFGACKAAKGGACAETSGYMSEAEAQGITCGWASPPGDGTLNPAATYSAGGNSYYFWSCNGLEDAPGACPPGQQPGYGLNGECGVPPATCPVGDEQRFHGDAGEPIPENICSNGCWYTAQYDDVPVTFNLKGTAWSGNFISTGNPCDLLAGESGGGGPPVNCISDNYGNTFCVGVGPDNAPPNCMEANGDQACLDAYDPQNCGYINGEPVCFDDYPDEGICEFLPGGSYICFSGDEAPQSPPYPDTGTPGEPAIPDVQMTQGDGAGGPGYSLDYFNSDTVEQSSGEGGAPGPDSDMSTPDAITLEGPVEVALNEPVEIDEEGTPQQSATDTTIFAEIFNQTGINELEAEIADIGAGTVSPMPSVPATLSDIDELFPTPHSCADPQLSFAGFSLVIPFSTMGQGLRDVLGWAFYIMTGLYLFGLVMSLPSKVK